MIISIFVLLVFVPVVDQYFSSAEVGKSYAVDWWHVGDSYTREAYPLQPGTFDIPKDSFMPIKLPSGDHYGYTDKTFEWEEKKDVSNSEFFGTLQLDSVADGYFGGGYVGNVKFDGSKFHRVILDHLGFHNCSFRNVDFRGVYGDIIHFHNCDFTGAYIHTDESSVDKLSNRAK
ncbi:MAG: pentapeptide repeat-containing protein [Planctomycetaceae bacterium]|nr:pentapeptide repeat-containing protein [Planctomycetaceae bacterium]